MFFHFSRIRFMTKPLSAVCKIMRCIYNIFKCCAAVARLCIHVLSLSNKHILLRHVATAYDADDPKAASTLLSSSSFHEGYAGETKLCKMMKLYSFHSNRSHDHNEVYIPYKQGC